MKSLSDPTLLFFPLLVFINKNIWVFNMNIKLGLNDYSHCTLFIHFPFTALILQIVLKHMFLFQLFWCSKTKIVYLKSNEWPNQNNFVLKTIRNHMHLLNSDQKLGTVNDRFKNLKSYIIHKSTILKSVVDCIYYLSLIHI